MIELGPFDLDNPVGRGGMGQVWSAVHRDLGYPVAVKFLTSRTYRKAGFLEAFRNEIRAVAALDHPNIVSVLDHGEASERTEKATLGRIPTGTPWLAMELVRGGTLAPLAGRLTWHEVESVVESLLGALSHAHARGVIHRDLKPGNVLVGTATGARHLWVKLTDFGLAQAVETLQLASDRPFTGGTPPYMAPEQFEGRWRDFGPWTDLYGAGCLLWTLIRGTPPFGGKRPSAELKRAHLHETLPRLVPPWEVPLGFEDWLARMLHKEPSKRFRRAADALHAFRELGPFFETDSDDVDDDLADMDTLVRHASDEDTVPGGEHTTMDLTLPEPADTQLALATSADDVPPLPADWRPDDLPLEGTMPTGLGLFGLRPPPLVDREKERDALWAALRRAVDDKQVQAVVLSGPDGCGKSRLADWLCQRAHEVGAAHVLRARHAPVAGPTHGLGPMLKSFLRCQGLERPAVLQRVEAIFRAAGVEHADEWEALTEVIHPARADETGAIRFGSPTERYVTVRRLLQGLTTERPVVVWLDDAHVALDALRFSAYLLDYVARGDLPVLLVLTVTDEELSARIDEASVLAELVTHDRARRVPVGPLPPKHRAALVRGILGLDTELARKVEDRTEGNPLFVVQLVDDWVQRGLLAPSSGGFRIREGVELDLPTDVRAMWFRRIERLLRDRPDAEQHALEVAAVLGADVAPDEWSAVCARARWPTEPTEGLVNALLDQRLARCGPDGPADGWSFAHRSLREALVARARHYGRLEGWHKVVAEVLEEHDRELGGTGLTERIGRHWLGAGSPAAAIPRLLAGARERANAGDYAIAQVLLALREEALASLPAPPSDPRWGEGWVLRFEIAALRGRWDDMDRWLDQVERAADRHSWRAIARRARCFRGRRARVRGRYERALELLIAVEKEAAGKAEHELLAEARREIGEVLLESGDVSGADTWVRLALEDYDRLSNTVGLADCWKTLGDAAKERGRHRESQLLLRKAEVLFAECGNRWGMASALNSRGDVARILGDLDQAESLYRRARGLLKAIGSGSWVYPEYNLGLVHLERGDHGRARRVLETAMGVFIRQGNSTALAHAHLALANCATADQQWLLWDEHLAQARKLLRVTGGADEDTARLATSAAQRAHEARQLRRARDAYGLAGTLWRTLDRSVELAEVDQILAAMDS